MSGEHKTILQALKAFSLEELGPLRDLRRKSPSGEKERIEALLAGSAKTHPALEPFDGLMYRSIERQDLSRKEQAYLQEHLLITTALYGVLPAYEGIAPHRLDFRMKLKPAGKSLKAFWKEDYDQAVEGEEQILSLCLLSLNRSFSKAIRERMIRIKFMENRGWDTEDSPDDFKESTWGYGDSYDEGRNHPSRRSGNH